jgi:hypothetical protein
LALENAADDIAVFSADAAGNEVLPENSEE